MCMASRSEPVSPKQAKLAPVALGRSAATGRLVLRPASKVGAISVNDVRNAVRNLGDTPKK